MDPLNPDIGFLKPKKNRRPKHTNPECFLHPEEEK